MSQCTMCVCTGKPLYHMHLFVYVKSTWESMMQEEKHFSFHHSCTVLNPKEASLRAASCPENGVYDGEQLRLPLSTEAWFSPLEGSL